MPAIAARVEDDRRLTALIDSIAPELTEVAGAEARAALRFRTHALPLDLARLLYVELRLDGEPGADLALRLDPVSALPLAIDADPDLARHVGGGPELAALLRMLREGDGAQAAAGWLEYDVASGDGEVASICATPATSAATPMLARLVGGAALTPEASATIEELTDGLRPGERIAQVAFMHARRPPTAVLTVRGRGLPHRASEVPALALSWPVPTLAVAVHLDGSISDRLGLELATPSAQDAERLLGALVEARLADTAAAERILAWHGQRLVEKSAVLATDLAILDGLTRRRLTVAVVRRLAHVKVTVAPGAPTTAKAYLSATLVPLL